MRNARQDARHMRWALSVCLPLLAGCAAPLSGRISRYEQRLSDLGSQLRQERFENRRLETENLRLSRLLAEQVTEPPPALR